MADERPPYYLERPDAPPPSFGAVAQSGILPEVRRSQEQYETAQKERAKRVGTRIEEEKQAITAVPHEAPPEAPAITKPPSVGLTPFLAPVEGERPENTIAKLIQGVGLLATGVAGRKDARASLAALTGALKGWQEGDKERADRHFADWQAQSETMLKNWQTKRTRWKDLQEDLGLTAQQRAKVLELDLLKEGFPVDVAKANLEGWQYLQGLMDKQQAHADMISLARDKFQSHRDQADRAFHEKVREFDTKQAAAPAPPDPTTVRYWAEQTLANHPPPMGMGGWGFRSALLAEVAKLSAERGINPADVPSLQAGLRASETELKRIQSTRGPVMAFAKTIDKHMEQVVELSEKRDATGVPAWNRWINKGRMAIAGDVAITDLNFMLRETINEYAKATSSVGGGGSAVSDTARKEIEEVLNTAMTKEQILSIFPIMKKALLNKQKGFEEQIGSTVEDMRGYFKGAPKAATPASAPPAGPGAAPTKPAVLIGPDGKRYDGSGVDATRLRPGWKLE